MESRPEARHSSSDFTPISQAEVVQATRDYFRSTPEGRDAALIRLQTLQDEFASQGGQYDIESLLMGLPERTQRIIRQTGVDARRIISSMQEIPAPGLLERFRRALQR